MANITNPKAWLVLSVFLVVAGLSTPALASPDSVLAYDDDKGEIYTEVHTTQYLRQRFLVSDFGLSGDYLVKIVRICWWRHGPEDFTGEIKLRDRVTGDIVPAASFSNPAEGWQDYDVSGSGFVSNDFYVELWQTAGYGYIYADTNEPHHGMSEYGSGPGENWYISALEMDFMIRALVGPVVPDDVAGRTIYVDDGNGDNSNDGLTLPTALATIQRGIDSAANGDTVIVVPATYTGGGNRDLDFRGKAITVRSIEPDDQDVVAATIIDCQGRKEEPHRGFYFHSGETSSAVIDGFTIKNGYKHPGAGIYCIGSDPIIKNCKITENTAEWNNGIGGGCFFSNSSAEIIDCQITFNSAIGTSRHSGNGWGGGIACDGSTLKIKNTEINNNYGTFDSGGVGAGWNSNLYIDNCVISHNSSQFGSGLKFQDANINITNSTITENSAISSGGGFYCIRSDVMVTNSILWGDAGGEIDGWDSSITVTYSDVQGGWAGEGNINADPLFVNTANADYHLQASSPCIDAGDNSAIPQSVVEDIDGNPRIINVIVDMGAYEFGIAPPPPTLSETLDTNLSFTTGGNADWSSQTATYYNDGDAAQSGDISHDQESWMQTTVSGAGTVAFYWKVSSEEDFDFLEFYIDGSLQEEVSGSVNWQQKTYTISTSGSHTLEWRYVKDKGTDSGSDCGWVDKLEWVPTAAPAPLPLAFNPDPADGATDVTQTPTLRWRAGERALLHDVYFGTDEEAVNNASMRSPEYKVTKDLGSESFEPGKLEWNTTYYWRVDEYNTDETISEGKVWSFTVVFMVDPLAEALDTDLSFTTGGDENWFVQSADYFNDGDVARSGDISHNQESWMQTAVSGAGTVSFFWKVSSEGNYDCLEFYIDGTLQDQISDSEDWHNMTYEITGSALHTLEWRYFKDGSMSRGDDCGWVDKVEWVAN